MSSWIVSFRRLGLYLCLPILQQAVYSQPANFKGDVSGVKVIRRLESYVRERAESRARIVNIESVPAIEALDGILAVPGLDGVLIGPHDLSCSLGIPEKYDHPRFLAAIETIFNKARAAARGAGPLLG
jgi:4-hydroxy-2-oxoheptanedioate aldolase